MHICACLCVCERGREKEEGTQGGSHEAKEVAPGIRDKRWTPSSACPTPGTGECALNSKGTRKTCKSHLGLQAGAEFGEASSLDVRSTCSAFQTWDASVLVNRPGGGWGDLCCGFCIQGSTVHPQKGTGDGQLSWWYLGGSQVGDAKEEQSSLQLRAVGPTDN